MSYLGGPSYRGLGYPKQTTDMGWPEENALWVYTPLPEWLALDELRRLSLARSIDDTDAVSFQPCPSIEDRSQDRYVVQDWELENGTWTFRAVFDGTVQLHLLIHRHLTSCARRLPQATPATTA
jgi:hypothetical protein